MSSFPTCYTEAREIAATRRRKLAHNTYLEVREHEIGVRLHSTEIVTFTEDGRLVLNSGGWRTLTTKERMNRALPPGFGLHQERGVWYLADQRNGVRYPYADGFTLHPDGYVSGTGPDPKAQHRERRAVARYVTRYMEALDAGDVPAPSGGDCWVCLMFAKGATRPDPEHIRSHMAERYYVPSLMARAIETFPPSMAARAYLSDRWAGTDNGDRLTGIGRRQLASSLKRYVLRQLGQAS